MNYPRLGILLTILVIVLIFLSLAGYYYQQGQKPNGGNPGHQTRTSQNLNPSPSSSPPEPIAIPTPFVLLQQTIKPVEDTTDWKTYHSETFRISFKYPPTRQVSEYTGLKTTLTTGDGESFLNLSNIKQTGFENEDIGSIILFLWYKDNRNISLTDFISSYRFVRQGNAPFQALSIGGKEAIRQDSLPNPQNEASVVYVRANNGYVYKILSGNFALPNAPRGEFDTILSTIKFF